MTHRRKLGVGLLMLILVLGTVLLAGFQPKPERAQLVLVKPVPLDDALTLVREAARLGVKTSSLLHVYVGRHNTFTGGIAIDPNRSLTQQASDIRLRHEAMIRDIIAQAELRLPHARSEKERESIEALIADLWERLHNFKTNDIMIYAINVEGSGASIHNLLRNNLVKTIYFEGGEVIRR